MKFRLSLTVAAAVALLATLIGVPASAQTLRPHVVTIPVVRIVASAAPRPPVVVVRTPVSPGCYTRKLDQGSGSVRICG